MRAPRNCARVRALCVQLEIRKFGTEKKTHRRRGANLSTRATAVKLICMRCATTNKTTTIGISENCGVRDWGRRMHYATRWLSGADAAAAAPAAGEGARAPLSNADSITPLLSARRTPFVFWSKDALEPLNRCCIMPQHPHITLWIHLYTKFSFKLCWRLIYGRSFFGHKFRCNLCISRNW